MNKVLYSSTDEIECKLKTKVVINEAGIWLMQNDEGVLVADWQAIEAAQHKMHPTKNGRGKSAKVSTPAVFGG